MKRRRYTQEFKAEAVRLAIEPGVSKAKVTSDLQINANLLRRVSGRHQMLKLQRYFAVLLLLSVNGCDWAGGLHDRLFNDPTRVVRVTTRDGYSVVLMQPEVDYLYPIGPGRFDRSAFKEGRGLRTTDGIIEWPAFTAVTIGRSRRTSGDVIGGGDIIYEADVQLRNGASAVKQLLDTPSRGLRGWRKAGDLPLTLGYVQVEIPLGAIARIELLDSVWERVPYSEYKTFRIVAQHKVSGTCEGEGRLYHPLPSEPNVHVAHDDPALGFRVEEQGMLLEIDPGDIREMTIGEDAQGATMTSFTFNNGTRRTYSMRDTYFRMNTFDGGCDQVFLFKQRSIAVAGAS